MTWRDQLRPASFRGVPFHVTQATGTFGRRSVTHEYPFRDLPYVEDLGRRARTLRIEALLLGEDYMARRDALIAAIEAAGPGKLVHPYYGELTVSVDDAGAQIEESTERGGMCRISFGVVEAGEARFPSATAATQEVVEQRAAAAQGASADGFAETVSTEGVPGFALESAYGLLSDALDAIESAIATMPGLAAGRPDLLGLVAALRPEIAQALRTPLALAQRVQSLFSTLRGALGAAQSVRTLVRFRDFGAGLPHIPTTTPSRRREAAHRAAVVELVRCSAAIERARATAALAFPDYETAVRTRDSVVEQIDRVADASLHDAVFHAMTALRAAVVRDVGQRGADLARVGRIRRNHPVPALVLAYDLYGDPARDADLIERNRIAHPGFLPTDRELEVLLDE
ncbi:MAG: DNA circularization protein [Pseudomonadota bacterium]